MGKQKTVCHICDNVMKTPKEEAIPVVCFTCEADLRDSRTEEKILVTVVQHSAGGVKGDLVNIYLTNERLIFQSDSAGGNAAIVGGILGGAIGGAIAGAIAGSGKKTGNFAYALVSGIASVDEEVAGVLKNKKQLNVRTRDGGTYSMTLSKKEGDKWKQEIESRIV